MGNARYTKDVEDFIDKIVLDEKVLERIDRIGIKGTKVVCIKKCHLMSTKSYDNFREYLENRKKEIYAFNEGEIYEVKKTQNDVIHIDGYAFELLDLKDCPDNHLSKRYPYVFDIFRTLSEDVALTREENINEILN